MVILLWCRDSGGDSSGLDGADSVVRALVVVIVVVVVAAPVIVTEDV